MSIINSHNITLHGSTGDYTIILKPLCDAHLPLLYKWGSDPEVVYWSDVGNSNEFDEESIRNIYGSVSQNALCFIAEVDGQLVGNFWLQKMNIPEVSVLYPGLDVRRIEAEIGEKNYWGRGIGSTITQMLIDYAFNRENVDVLHCFAADYNLRSQKTLLKRGFILCGEEDVTDSLRAKNEFHYCLTRENYTKARV
jgi:RimJ/RimL family protein N-acetyltransferase